MDKAQQKVNRLMALVERDLIMDYSSLANKPYHVEREDPVEGWFWCESHPIVEIAAQAVIRGNELTGFSHRIVVGTTGIVLKAERIAS